MIWVSGSNNNANPNNFYRYRPNGAPLDVVRQPGSSAYGFRGLTTDGELLWGGEGAWLKGMNAEAIIVDSIPAPLQIQRAIAFDRSDSCFWIANGQADPLVKIDHAGNIIASYQLELNITGLAYFPTDADGFSLYILSRDRTNPDLTIPQALISKMNPLTGDLRVITPLEGEATDQSNAMAITSHLDPTKWVLLATMDNTEGDRLSSYDLGPSTSWVSYSPRSGQLDPGSSTEIELTINTDGLEVGDYRLLLRYLHNAAGLKTDIPVHLEVNENAGVNDVIQTPFVFKLNEAYPNPFNATTVVPFTLAKSSMVKLALFDLTGRESLKVLEGELTAGNHAVTVDGAGLPSGVYLIRLEADGLRATSKVALVK